MLLKCTQTKARTLLGDRYKSVDRTCFVLASTSCQPQTGMCLSVQARSYLNTQACTSKSFIVMCELMSNVAIGSE